MSAEDREQERGAQPAPSAAGVSMRALLDSCAAADVISKPPSGADPESVAEQAGEDGAARDGQEPSAPEQPKRDAA